MAGNGGQTALAAREAEYLRLNAAIEARAAALVEEAQRVLQRHGDAGAVSPPRSSYELVLCAGQNE